MFDQVYQKGMKMLKERAGGGWSRGKKLSSCHPHTWLTEELICSRTPLLITAVIGELMRATRHPPTPRTHNSSPVASGGHSSIRPNMEATDHLRSDWWQVSKISLSEIWFNSSVRNWTATSPKHFYTSTRMLTRCQKPRLVTTETNIKGKDGD